MVTHGSQARIAGVLTPSVPAFRSGAHSQQKTPPHCRQWCLRRVMLNFFSHPSHATASSFGFHDGPSVEFRPPVEELVRNMVVKTEDLLAKSPQENSLSSNDLVCCLSTIAAASCRCTGQK